MTNERELRKDEWWNGNRTKDEDEEGRRRGGLKDECGSQRKISGRKNRAAGSEEEMWLQATL